MYDISMGSGTMLSKPTGCIITPDVWKATVHLAGSLPRHRLTYPKKPPDTYRVRGIGKGDLRQAKKMDDESLVCRSIVP